MAENTRVPARTEAVDRARDVKESNGETWTDVMEFYAEHRDGGVPDTPEAAVDTEALAEDVADRLDGTDAEALADLYDAVATIEDRTGTIEQTLEGLQR